MSVGFGNSVYDSRNNCNAIVETATNTIIAGCNNSDIPITVTSIGVCAFQGCQLRSLDLHNNIVAIGEGAFSRCISIPSITIPKSVKSIGENAFGYCNNVKSITVSPLNETYDSRNNCNAIIETRTNRLINGCNSSTIPNTVVSIENYAFWGCMSMTVMKIPESVVTIGDYAFYDCSSLVSVTIPKSVVTIGNNAFYSCSSLVSIYCLAALPPICGNWVFDNDVQETATLYVPFGCLQKYKEADVWKDFIHVEELPQGYGVEESSEIEISVFPNPAIDLVNINCQGMTKVTVYGMRGETIKDVNVNADKFVVTGLDAGTYFLRIETTKGSITQKIVKL